MRKSAIFVTLLLLISCGQQSEGPPTELSLFADLPSQKLFPLTPEDSLTPGSLCKNPSEYRYPEKIPYCNRSVSTPTKYKVIKAYDQTLSYSIGSLSRNDFKIDHFIPLCLGGSNDTSNLWPQHKSVYAVTDVLEPRLCGLLERGAISQADAILKIKFAKHNLDLVNSLMNELDTQFGVE